MRWVAISLVMLIGCTPASPRAPRMSRPVRIAELEATALPPAGWRIERADQTGRYVQRVWVSPSGRTSYGVIHFTMPLPVGERIALAGFLAEMKRSEGDARLISKGPLDGRLAFVAEGGKYRVDGIIVTQGLRGWAIYAGTLRRVTAALDELELAVQARENTMLGKGDIQNIPSR
jgi:hypothetical protein